MTETKIILRYLIGWAAVGLLKAAAVLGIGYLVLLTAAWISDHLTEAGIFLIILAAWAAFMLWLWRLYRRSLGGINKE